MLIERLRFDEVFDEPMLSFNEYIEGIGSEDLEVSIAGLINVSNDKRYLNAKNLVSTWLIKHPALRLELFNKLRNDQTILNIYSSLKFAENILSGDKRRSNPELKTPEKSLRLLKAYLTINSEQERLEFIDKTKIPESDNFITTASCFVISMNIHDSEFINVSLSEVLFSQLGKSIEFFNYLSCREELIPHLKRFLIKHNCQNWQQWIVEYLNVLACIVTEENKSEFDLLIPQDDNHQRKCLFLDFMTIERANNFDKYDFLSLRSKPLLKVSNNKYRILSKLFTLEKLFKSILFEFNFEINPNLPKENQISNFRSDHCEKFSEETLLYNIVERSFPNSWLKIPGSTFVGKKFDAEPDYYMRYENNLFLFESKDVFLTAEVKQSRNYRQLEDALKKKFYKTELNGIVKNSAVLQLVNNIKRVLSGYYAIMDPETNVNELNIYPILIIHDRTFDSLGVNQLIRQWFNAEMNLLKNQFNISKVRELVILNIDKLVLHQDILKARKIKLECEIDEYLALTNMEVVNPRSHVRELNPYMHPFSGFLEKSIRSLNLQETPDYITRFVNENLIT